MKKVFFTADISPEGLVKAYDALGATLKGKVAVKISTGEPGGHNFLQPAQGRKGNKRCRPCAEGAEKEKSCKNGRNLL